MSESIVIKVERLDDSVVLPEYAYIGDSGMDVRANENCTLYAGETRCISTGLKVEIPEGYEIVVRPRSGLSLKTPLRISNSPGTIDSSYRDEIGIIIAHTDLRGDSYIIRKGDRIAQLVLQKVPKIVWVEGKVNKSDVRDNGGFGSSGVK